MAIRYDTTLCCCGLSAESAFEATAVILADPAVHSRRNADPGRICVDRSSVGLSPGQQARRGKLYCIKMELNVPFRMFDAANLAGVIVLREFY
eukprot:COSAG01_NODE_1603_length_9758_cov_7.506471_2_plen_93_part_00